MNSDADTTHPSTLVQAFREEYYSIHDSLPSLLDSDADSVVISRRSRQVDIFLGRLDQHENIFSQAEFEIIRRNTMLIQHDIRIRRQTATELSHHGRPSAIHAVRSGRPGRPRYQIDEEFLRFAYQTRSITSIAAVLGVHRNTVRLALIKHGMAQRLESPFIDLPTNDGRRVLSYTGCLSRLSGDQLDDELRKIRTEEGFDRAGVTILHGLLRSRGHKVPRERIRLSLMRIDPENRIFRSTPVRRRTYTVPGPNAVWHHDGQHGLIRYGLVIHGFIDGFSRLVTGLKASNNNRAETVLKLFLNAARKFGVPNRVRGDHGVENLQVAAWMDANVGGEGGSSYIWGRSVHNTRIERLWVDVKTQVSGRWLDAFRTLEESHGLDINNENHTWLLQVLFLPMLNADLSVFQSAWNNHSVRRPGEEHRSPADLFVFGMFEQGIRGYQLPPSQADSPELEAQLLQVPDSLSAYPQRLSGVELNAPNLTGERAILMHRILNGLEARRHHGVPVIWTGALIDCRAVFPSSF